MGVFEVFVALLDVGMGAVAYRLARKARAETAGVDARLIVVEARVKEIWVKCGL